jgi:hypothetical protein
MNQSSGIKKHSSRGFTFLLPALRQRLLFAPKTLVDEEFRGLDLIPYWSAGPISVRFFDSINRGTHFIDDSNESTQTKIGHGPILDTVQDMA